MPLAQPVPYFSGVNLNDTIMLTYILGAGASYGLVKESFDEFHSKVIHRQKGIPIVSMIPEELLTFTSTLRQVQNFTQKIPKELIDEFQWLYDKIKDQVSIDTYAKKLLIAGKHDQFVRVNRIFSLFLLANELLYPIDARYDGLFSSIFDFSDNNLKSQNVNIITWNYDLQLNRSLASFCQIEKIMSAKGLAKEYVPKMNIGENKISDYSIFRLNGSISYALDYDRITENSGVVSELVEVNEEYDFTKSHSISEVAEIINKLYSTFIQNHKAKSLHPNILYAWDLTNKFKDVMMMNHLSDIIRKSKDVVIIGYSFPYFNREIDKKIFEKYDPHTNIHVQDPNLKDVVVALNSVNININPSRINTIDSMKQFYFPPSFQVKNSIANFNFAVLNRI